MSSEVRETSAERRRLSEGGSDGGPWKLWGPFLSERQWGTVREDYSPDGDRWRSLPARPRSESGVSLG